MRNYRIQITVPAEKDLQLINDYIIMELREPSIAKNMIAKIASAILELEQMPLRNALVSDDRLANQRIRKLIVDNYIVFYVVSENDEEVTIARILYGKRDWINIL